jgi:hypothetical protein
MVTGQMWMVLHGQVMSASIAERQLDLLGPVLLAAWLLENDPIDGGLSFKLYLNPCACQRCFPAVPGLPVVVNGTVARVARAFF